MAFTGTNVITNNVDVYFDRVFLMELFPNLLHTLFGKVKSIPRNAGTRTARFRRYNKLAVADTPLSEGVTPTEDVQSITEVEATALQYGIYQNITDLVDFTTQDPLVTEITMLQGEQAARTFDTLTREELVTGTSVSYGGAATSRITVAAGMVITTTMIENSILTLENNDSKKLKSIVNASTGIGTQAINEAYVAICNPSVGMQVRDLTGFIDVKDYSSQADVMPGEIGAYRNVRFIQTTQAKTFTGAGAAGIDVETLLIMGRDAYGTVQISGENLKTIRKAPIDPLDQISTIGWKGTFVAKILDNRSLHRLEFALA